MMMGGTAGGMIWGSLLLVVLLLGFAYIVWVLATKETGAVKTTGQVIAIIIAVLALIVLLYGSIYGGMRGRGLGGDRGYKTMGPGMMMHKMGKMSDTEMREMAEKMMENPRMRECFEDALKK